MPRRTQAAKLAAPVVHTTIEMPSVDTKPASEEGKPDFWTYMRSLSPEEWRNHIVYITRENPKTSIGGVGGYLCKVVQPFDIDEIKNTYGGYEFSYIMKKENKIVYSGSFKIEAPPKLDPNRESSSAQAPAAGSVDSQLAGQIISMLREELQKQPASPANDRAMQLLTEASTRAMDMIKAQMPQQQTPANQLADILTLAERLRPNDSSNQVVLQMLGVFMPLVTKALTPVDPLDQLTKMGAAIEVMEKIRGGEGKPTDWKSMLVGYAPEILQTLQNFAPNRNAAPPRPALPRQAGPAAPAPAQSQNAPAPAPGALQTQTFDRAAGIPPMQQQSQQQIEPQEVAQTQEQFDQAFKVQIVNLVRMGVSAETLVDFLYDVKPDLVKDMVAYPEAAITQWFQQDQILVLVTQDPRWTELLREARKYIAETAEEEPLPAVQ